MLHNSGGESGIESRLLLKGYCCMQAFGLFDPFAFRVHENFRVKSFWCIPGEEELLSIALLSLVQELHPTAVS